MSAEAKITRQRKLSRADIEHGLADAHADLMESVVAGCALVAYSDGWVSEAEERRMIGLIRRFEPITRFDLGEVLDRFDAVTRVFSRDFDQGEEHALALLTRLSGRKREADLLIEICCAIAEADGGFDREERDALLKMCERLGVHPGDHDL